ENNSVPKTGDNTNTVVWMAVMFSSMTALAVVLKKKKEYEDR
ncbi:MAG: LPXTG cell wall anchor domain-containing protein, partial [Oscillospiraceae bacterium]|nr:LPXTG cell wall anchor domain-containing protein [Oscillospiraceae bacterium]